MEKTTRNVLIALVVIVIVLAGAAYVPQLFEKEPETPTVTYNGYVFEQYGGVWNTQWQRDGFTFNVRMRFHPGEVEDVPVVGEVSSNFTQSDIIFVTHDAVENRTPKIAHLNAAAIDVSRALVTAFDRDVVGTCTSHDAEACRERPIITCDLTNAGVIYLLPEGETQITLDDNCVTIQGEGDEIIRATSKAIYLWYNII